MEIVPLQVQSSYSLLQSTIKIQEYVNYAKKIGYTALALTDEKVLYGALEFYKACKKENIKPILGLSIPIEHKEAVYSLLLYAKNYEGFKELAKLSSLTQFDQAITIEKLIRSKENLVALVPVVQSKEMNGETVRGRVDLDFLDFLKESFADDFYIGMPEDYIREAPPTEIKEWFNHSANILPLFPVRYLHQSQQEAVGVLKYIDENSKIEEKMNSEIEGTYLYTPQVVNSHLDTYFPKNYTPPFAEFSSKMDLAFPLHQKLLPHFPLSEGVDRNIFLKDLAMKGLQERVPSFDERYLQRLKKELAVIEKMEFSDYFLIVWDLMGYARKKNILTGPGRGSAAGSLLAYVLKITDVDPIQYDLLFERFLNEERATMPDIDLDFPDNKREMILEYVERKYGKDHVAQIATFGTFKARQALRDVGRVFGLSQNELAEIAKTIPEEQGLTLKQAYKQSASLKKLVESKPLYQKVFTIAQTIEGIPRHVSTHAAGVVISESPLDEWIPLQKGNGVLQLTQFPMGDIEEIGLLKMDFLGLKNLTLLFDILQFVKKKEPAFELKTISPTDEETFQLFQKGDTVGIFQFESRGIQNVLKQIHPESLEELVAVNALYRPGPMEQIPHFVKRKQGKEEIVYPHPDLKPILEVTYGVVVYQEQVMKIATSMAGFSLGEADLLRRAMSKKDQQALQKKRIAFIEGAANKGYSKSVAQTVYDYIERFANYGFNRSHSVAYSLLAYQLAYFKTHYPLEFYTALLNSVKGNKEKTAEMLLKLKKIRISVLSPDINLSNKDFSTHFHDLLVGFNAIKGIRRDFIESIISERNQHGPYKDFINFVGRIEKRYRKSEYLEKLIYSGCFDSFGMNRGALIQSVEGIIKSVEYSGDSQELLAILKPKYEKGGELTVEQKLEGEFETLGFYLSGHPVEKYQVFREQQKLDFISEYQPSKPIRSLVYVKNTKRIQTKNGEFMLFADVTDETDTISLTFFPEVYRKFGALIQPHAVIYIEGKVESRQGKKNVLVNKVAAIENVLKEQAEDPVETATCFIKIHSAIETVSSFEEIKQVLKNHPGTVPVIVFDEKSGKKIQMNKQFNITLSPGFLKELAAIVDSQNIVVKK
ncbi:DNA polymerase III subunit alpha [Lacticigenium naphthae]|uniref:DNA polymerase III subunit alpha n=1 Tax=Lacticigenium naphthae TaxID=515351 RepID=UPI00040077BF|nr:DNA polymerase III subunit alpha [Lacticigenium naphthae]